MDKITNISHFNDLWWSKVCKNLNLLDLNNLQQVNRRLYSFVDKFRLSSLIVKDRDDYDYMVVSLNLFIRLFSSPFLNNLKRLSVQDSASKWPTLNLSLLCNRFVHLESLEIEKFEIRNQDLVLIQLPKLRELKLTLFNSDFIVNAPSLTDLTLDCYGSNVIQFACPKTVIRLSILNYYDDYKLLPNFINVQQLELHLELDLILEQNLLAFYPKLKRLFLRNLHTKEKTNLQDFSIVAKLLDHLINQYNIHKRKIKIYCLSVELSTDKPVYLYRLAGRYEPSLDLIVNYYQHLTEVVDSVTELDYNALISKAGGQLAHHFFSKFNRIEYVKVEYKPLDPIYLLNFLYSLWMEKTTNKLTLNLYNTALGQDFFDRLPSYCSLTKLFIFQENDSNINYGFLKKLNNLEHLRTNQEISFKLLIQWFKRKQIIKNYFRLDLLDSRQSRTVTAIRFYNESGIGNRLKSIVNVQKYPVYDCSFL